MTDILARTKLLVELGNRLLPISEEILRTDAPLEYFMDAYTTMYTQLSPLRAVFYELKNAFYTLINIDNYPGKEQIHTTSLYEMLSNMFMAFETGVFKIEMPRLNVCDKNVMNVFGKNNIQKLLLTDIHTINFVVRLVKSIVDVCSYKINKYAKSITDYEKLVSKRIDVYM